MTKHTVQQVWEEVQTIKNNHLTHIHADIESIKRDMTKMDKQFEKMDQRLWAILIMLVGGVILPAIIALVK